MALRRSTARRYAEAAFEIAVRDDAVDAWLAALAAAEERLSDPQAARLLASPAVPVAARVELLDRLLGPDAAGGPRNLVALLIRRGRFDELGAVVREFRRLDARRRGRVEAVVTSAAPLDEALTMEVRGRHQTAGLPKSVPVTDAEIRDALRPTVDVIIKAVREGLEKVPPELSADIYDRGVVITGGGALLRNLDKRLREDTDLPVQVAEDPLSSVVLGAGRMLSNIGLLKKLAAN